jgi:putative transcriptional regulator
VEIKEIRKLSGLSQPQFSEKYNIPLPSLRHWEQGQRECPKYVLELLEFKVREDLKAGKG